MAPSIELAIRADRSEYVVNNCEEMVYERVALLNGFIDKELGVRLKSIFAGDQSVIPNDFVGNLFSPFKYKDLESGVFGFETCDDDGLIRLQLVIKHILEKGELKDVVNTFCGMGRSLGNLSVDRSFQANTFEGQYEKLFGKVLVNSDRRGSYIYFLSGHSAERDGDSDRSVAFRYLDDISKKSRKVGVGKHISFSW